MKPVGYVNPGDLAEMIGGSLESILMRREPKGDFAHPLFAEPTPRAPAPGAAEAREAVLARFPLAFVISTTYRYDSGDSGPTFSINCWVGRDLITLTEFGCSSEDEAWIDADRVLRRQP